MQRRPNQFHAFLRQLERQSDSASISIVFVNMFPRFHCKPFYAIIMQRHQRQALGCDFPMQSNPPEGARTQIFTENEHLNVNGDHLAIDQQRNIALKTEAGLLRQKSSSFSRIDGAARVMSNDGSTRSKEGRVYRPTPLFYLISNFVTLSRLYI